MMDKEKQVFFQDWLQFLLPTGRDKEGVSTLMEQPHHISAAQTKQGEDSPNHSRASTRLPPLILLQFFYMSLIILCKPAAHSLNQKNNALPHWDSLKIKVLANVK